jgi:UDP-glucose 4-epimerase
MSTVFITGGAGFIGSHVIPMLLERGDKVRLFDNMFRGDRDKVAELVANSNGNVEFIDQDVRYGGAVHAAMKGCDKVIHLAAVSINKSQADPFESVDINMVGGNNVFAAAADHGISRVVFASSASVYGDPETLPMREDGPVSPLTPYCIGKLASEYLLDFYARRSSMTWIALRFFNVYGPGQMPTAYYTSVINHFVKRLRAGEPPVIDGKGEQSMDFTHVHDVARANVLAMKCEAANQIFNVGTGVSTTVKELAEILAAALGVDVEPEFSGRQSLVSRRQADTRKAEELLGFIAKVDVRTGLTDVAKAIAAMPSSY